MSGRDSMMQVRVQVADGDVWESVPDRAACYSLEEAAEWYARQYYARVAGTDQPTAEFTVDARYTYDQAYHASFVVTVELKPVFTLKEVS